MPNPAARARHRLTDPPEPDDAQHRAVHVDAVVRVEAPAFPPVAAQIGFGLRCPTGRAEDEQEGEVGGRVVEHTGRVADRDAEPFRGGDVDVVVTDGNVAHHSQPSGRAGLEHLGIDRIEQQAHDPVVGWAPTATSSACGRRLRNRPHDFVTRAAQHLEPGLGEGTGHQHAGHRRNVANRLQPGNCPLRHPGGKCTFTPLFPGGGRPGGRGIWADPVGGAMRAWGDRLGNEEHDDRHVDPREVVVRYRVEMFRFARSLSRNDADAEDLAQSAALARARVGHAARSDARQGVPVHDPAQPRHRPGAPSRPHRDGAARRASGSTVDRRGRRRDARTRRRLGRAARGDGRASGAAPRDPATPLR